MNFDISDIYNSLNFNDYYRSIITMITILFSDSMTIAIMNNNEVVNQIYYSYQAFFVSYMLITQICLMNIIFGFLIDNCQSYLVDLLGDNIKKEELKEIMAEEQWKQKLLNENRRDFGIKNFFKRLSVKLNDM